MKKSMIFCLFLVANIVYANPLSPKNFGTITKEELSQERGNNNIQDLKTNNFYLSLDPKEIDLVKQKDKEVKEAFDGFSQKEINYKPVIRPISTMDTITLHPYFSVSLVLPQGAIISHIDSSSEMNVLKYENNIALIRPKSDFEIANFTIIYKLNDTNFILNLLANRYKKDEALDRLNLVYSYSKTKKLSNLEVIQAYVKQNGSYPKNKYSYIKIDDISYRIVEDSKYGDIFVNQKKYRVDYKTIYQ